MWALADRFTEAFVVRTHERVRTELWGYASIEALDNAALIKEEHPGICHTSAYSERCDQAEKQMLFGLLDAQTGAGMRLGESYSTTSVASVSGGTSCTRRAVI